MRASQLWQWLYNYGHTDFDKMTNIGKQMRQEIATHFAIQRPEMVERQVSQDGTRKYLLRLGPGAEVECVFIPDVGRSGALCVSSQVGCTLACTFCHTGTQKLVRNLTAAEIVRSGFGREGRSGRMAKRERRSAVVEYRLYGHGRAAV